MFGRKAPTAHRSIVRGFSRLWNSFKVFGLINQIVSVSLITSTLGAEGLQEQLLAISLVTWFNLTLFGMHTSLPAALIHSGADNHAFSSIIKSAYLFAMIGAFSALGLLLFVRNMDC